MHSWVVVVVRAWSENGGLRVRMLCAGPEGDPDVRLAASPDEAANRLREWLEQLQQGEPEVPPEISE